MTEQPIRDFRVMIKVHGAMVYENMVSRAELDEIIVSFTKATKLNSPLRIGHIRDNEEVFVELLPDAVRVACVVVHRRIGKDDLK